MVNTDPVWTTLPYSYIQRWYTLPRMAMLRFQLVHYNYSIVLRAEATRTASLLPSLPLHSALHSCHSCLAMIMVLLASCLQQWVPMKDRKCLFIHNHISLATHSARLDEEDGEKTDPLVFHAAMFCVVSWMLQFNVCSVSMSVTGVCKNISETLLTFLIHCIFLYFVVRRKQGSRVLCLVMSLSIFVWIFFVYECSTHTLPCSFITGYKAFRNALHTWRGRFYNLVYLRVLFTSLAHCVKGAGPFLQWSIALTNIRGPPLVLCS